MRRKRPYTELICLICGFHAGDPSVMQKSVLLCKKYGVQVGAHPGLPDLQGFGRCKMAISPAQAEENVIYQIGALKAFCDAAGVSLHHVKPHGALYNMAAKDPELAAAICRAVMAAAPEAVLLALSGSEMIKAAQTLGLRVCSEVFADRGYQPDGTLVPRGKSGAMIENEEEAIARVLQMASRGRHVPQTEVPLRCRQILSASMGTGRRRWPLCGKSLPHCPLPV